jgi:glycosyltransferase involved in cell wall biosynthesis
MKLSVIIPTYNEMKLKILAQITSTIQKHKDIEVLCVDRESNDGTAESLAQAGVQIIRTPLNSRGARLNLGIEHAQGKIILLQHPRTHLPLAAYHFLLENGESLKWGGFYHKFDWHHPLLQFTSWYSNYIRPRTQRILYLDHCIFINKKLMASLPRPIVPEVDIMEDTELCKKLRAVCKPQLLPYTGLTSATRFRTNGVARQIVLNQLIKVSHLLKIDSQKMNRIYERNMNLNSKYD